MLSAFEGTAVELLMRLFVSAFRCCCVLLCVVASTTLVACGEKQSPQTLTPPVSASSSATAPAVQYVNQFIEDYFIAHPSLAASEGRHEFDGQLPDWSKAGIEREVARLHAARAQAEKFLQGSLTATERLQIDYVISQIGHDLFWMERAQWPFKNPAWYLNGLDPSTYLIRPYAPLEQRMRAVIQYAKAIPVSMAQIDENLRSPLPHSYIDYGIAAFSGFVEFFRKDVPEAFADVKDPALQQELKAALDGAANAMQKVATRLQRERAQGTDDYAMGADMFAQMLRDTEGVTTPLAELERIGRNDLQRNQAALKEACAQVLPGGSIATCVQRVNADKPAGGVVEGARAQLDMLKRFVREHDLVSIPADEQALVAFAPAYNRQNSAYIDVPGPWDKSLPSVFYIAPPDPSWSKAEREAYIQGKADLLFTSVHEVWPGHFLQFLISNRAPLRIEQVFVGYGFAEGWAHYAEEMMWDEGLGNGAADIHVGQLLNALLRNVRFMCAIGLHTQAMTVAQCEKMFREQAYQDAGNARQQAARGTYDPAYLNYTMAKLMIRKLRSDWLAESSGRKLRDFHDTFLSFGGPPVPLIRREMLKQDDGALF